MCKNAARFNPKSHPQRSLDRRNVVLAQMEKAGFLTEAQTDSLQATDIVLDYHEVDQKVGQATYFREYLRSIMRKTKPERKTKHKGGSDNTPVPLSILPPGRTDDNTKESDAKLRELAASLEHTLLIFGIEGAKVDNIIHGPTITRFEVPIGDGVKVSRVKSLENDIALRMAASTVRIEAPIPGKSAIGIEIPNKKKMSVSLREVLDTQEFMNSSPLTVGIGKDVAGKPLYCDLAKMPHLLVAGATGAGKSVCLNSMLVSILCKASYK
jgi:DNA segregation ATPase FtsK/SpoIIIE-like protein